MRSLIHLGGKRVNREKTPIKERESNYFIARREVRFKSEKGGDCDVPHKRPGEKKKVNRLGSAEKGERTGVI